MNKITWTAYKKKYSRFVSIKYLRIGFSLTKKAESFFKRNISELEKRLAEIKKKLNKPYIIFTNSDWATKGEGTEWIDLTTGIGGEIKVHNFD